MSDLPARPHLDQLRHQARDLLRSAQDGEPGALNRIRAVSERVSLSASQLALAREYGFTSWPALAAEVGRRMAALPGSAELTGPGWARWSFGGGDAIETTAGTLTLGAMVAGPAEAHLEAVLTLTGAALDRLTAPRHRDEERVNRAADLIPLVNVAIGAMALTDDQGTGYALRFAGGYGGPGFDGATVEPVSLTLAVEPVPAPGVGWLELRGERGSVTRLLPSPRPEARVSRLEPVPEGAAARELAGRALGVIELKVLGADADEIEAACSAALSRAAQIQASGSPGAVGDRPERLRRLCGFLTGRGPADGLPGEWATIIEALDRIDGPPYHLDVAAALPAVDGVAVRVDSLASGPDSWRVYLTAAPDWWITSADGMRKWTVMTVHAEDDLGGLYLSGFGGSHRVAEHEELSLRFWPRLDPLARVVTLVFTRGAEQVTVELRLR